MKQVVISGSGLFTPPHSISNEALVESFNAYVDMFNLENAGLIEQGHVAPLGFAAAFKQQDLWRCGPKAVQHFLEPVKGRSGNGLKQRAVHERTATAPQRTMVCVRSAPTETMLTFTPVSTSIRAI